MEGIVQTDNNTSHILSGVKKKLDCLVDELYTHDGYGRIEIDMKILKKGQKEVLLKCGKEYRFVVDWRNEPMVMEM